jgi:hypothetical protein
MRITLLLIFLLSCSVLSGAQSATPGTTYHYCTDVGPVSLTIDDTSVSGKYKIVVVSEPFEGELNGILKNGLLEASWTDKDGTGRIIIGFGEQLKQFTAIYNSRKNPSRWYSWIGVLSSEVTFDQKQTLHCD